MAGPKLTIEKWQNIALYVLIPVAAIGAILHEVWKSFPDWAVAPILFAAALAIIIQNEKVLGRMRSVEIKVGEILSSRASVRVYNTYGEFYSAMGRSASNARREVRASYMRRFPPASLGGEAVRFFDCVVEWAHRDPNHLLRRVFCKPEGTLLEWVKAQDDISQREASNYSVKIVDWTVRDVDAVSVAIIDDDLVFFVFSGQKEAMKGFSIKDARIATFFIEYYTQLWLSAQTLDEFISKKRPKTDRRLYGPLMPIKLLPLRGTR
jgi:hypothetical protein